MQPAAMTDVVFPSGETRPALGVGTWRLGATASRAAAEVASLVNDAIERILAGRAPAAQVLPPVARRVRELSRQP